MTSQHTARTANAAAQIPLRAATHALFHKMAPQETDAKGSKTWITRGANFVVAVSDVEPGTVLQRANNPDEYFVLLSPGASAVVDAGADRTESKGDALFVCPPGASSVTATTKGRIARIFSKHATDLCQKAFNAAAYADGARSRPPSSPGPSPRADSGCATIRSRSTWNPKRSAGCFAP